MIWILGCGPLTVDKGQPPQDTAVEADADTDADADADTDSDADSDADTDADADTDTDPGFDDQCGENTTLPAQLNLPVEMDGRYTREDCADGTRTLRILDDWDGDQAADLVEWAPCEEDVVRVWSGASGWSEARDLALPNGIDRSWLFRVDPKEDRVWFAEVDGRCGKDLVLTRPDGTVHVYPDRVDRFGGGWAYDSWTGVGPGVFLRHTCDAGAFDHVSEGRWWDIDGDRREDFWAYSDGCEIFPDGRSVYPGGWDTLTTSAMDFVSTPSRSRPLQVLPGRARELVLHQGGDVMVYELVSGQWTEWARWSSPDGAGSSSGHIGTETNVYTAPCGDGGQGELFLRDLDGDGYAEQHFESAQCPDWWAPGGPDGWGDPVEFEPPQADAWLFIDQRWGWVRFGDGQATSGGLL